MSESQVSSSDSDKNESLVEHKSIGIQTDENEQVFLCRNDSHCSHFQDKENFLWFICPICTQAFSRHESKLVEHKQKVHGICNKNRTAFILSQTDLSPNVCMESSIASVPKFLLNVKNNLEVDSNVSPHTNQKLDPNLKPSASFSSCNQLGKLDVEDMPTDDEMSVLYGCDGSTRMAPAAASSNVIEDVDIKSGNSIVGTRKYVDIPSQFLKDDYSDQIADQSDTECNSPEPLPNDNMDEFDSINKPLGLNLQPGKSEVGSPGKKKRSQEQVFKLENHSRPPLKWSMKKPVKTEPHFRFISKTITNGISIYECKFCNTSFKNVKEWTSHQIFGHKNEEKPFYCKICSSSFVNNSRRNRHYLQVHRSKQYECSQCQKKFRNESQYKFHINSHITSGEGDPTDNSKIKKPFVCDICEKRFVTEIQLQEHSNIHNSRKPYQCADCGKCYSTRWALSTHKTLHNPKYANASTDCHLCGKKLTSFISLQKHIKIVHETTLRLFLCSTCGKDFKTSGSLKKHIDTMHLGKPPPRPFTCKDCGYKSTSRSLLRIHAVKHATERPFVCEICTKAFKDTIALKTHKKGHTGERKRFVCPTCGQRFTLRATLENHQLVSHPVGEIEYKFACKICGKKYAIERYLAAHEIRHDLSALKHSCHICGKRFLEARRLRTHLEVHNRGGILRNRKFILKMVSSINDEPDIATGDTEPSQEMSAEVKTLDIDNEKQAEQSIVTSS